MSRKHTLTSSNTQQSEEVNSQIDDYWVKVNIETNEYDLDLHAFFEMAIRKNLKRSFLFVSKVLGKHLRVDPKRAMLAGELLACKCFAEVYGNESPMLPAMVAAFDCPIPVDFKLERMVLPEKTLVIGFAETATALGHIVFNAFDNARYVHTTREVLEDFDDPIVFEEEHSHSTTHYLYIDPSFIDDCQTVFLVDDEISTGKTVVNIIREMSRQWKIDQFVVLSYLNWQSKENHARFLDLEKECQISIQVVSLISGKIAVADVYPVYPEVDLLEALGMNCTVDELPLPQFASRSNISQQVHHRDVTHVPYIEETGRFGLDSSEHARLDLKISVAALCLTAKRKSEKTLCIGTGEFMYLPLRIAKEMGENIAFQSSTRSPIYALDREDYPIRNRIKFSSPENPAVVNYLYNLETADFDEVFLFLERKTIAANLEPLLAQLKGRFANLHIVYFSAKRGDSE